MEKIIGVLQRWLKNILNYNMEKLEKSFYIIIENKKRGKFSGAGPIQVAKKVASKKLKSGKEMEFYLDEVCGKTKRYGPYQARKDKNSGQVVVVKGGKVMKGGLLSSSDIYNLREIFKNFNENYSINQNNFVKSRLPLIPFGREPIVYFYPVGSLPKVIYKFAVFKERVGNIYIMIHISDINIEIISFDDFFLNQYYSKYLVSNNKDLDKKQILESLQNPDIIESRTIREEARKIYDILYIPTDDEKKHKVIIYVPNYYQPLIRKCVYPDLTFGILDEQTSAIIPQNKNDFPIPESPYQKYLIFKKTGMSGMSLNEPIIYVRKITINRQNQRGGNMIIDNYLTIIDELIHKINIRNNINSKNKGKYLSLSTNNIALTTPSGIKKMNDNISNLEQEIILKKKSEYTRTIEKKSQLGRLRELKIVLLQRKLELQGFKTQNEQQLQEKQKLQQQLNGLQKQKELRQVFNGLQKQKQLQEFKQEKLPKFQNRNEQLQKLQKLQKQQEQLKEIQKQQEQLKEIQEKQQQLQKKQLQQQQFQQQKLQQQQQFQQQKLQQQQLLEQQLQEKQKLEQQLNKFPKIKNPNEQQLQQLQQQTKNIHEQFQKLQKQQQQLEEIQEQQQLLEQQLLEPEIKEKQLQLQLQLQLQQQQKLQKQLNEFPGIKNLNEQELQQQIQNIQNQQHQQLELNKVKKQQQIELNKVKQQQQIELNKVKQQQLNKLQQQLNGLQEFKNLNEQHLQLRLQQLQLQQLEQLEQHFDYCIYSSGLNQLKIRFYDNNTYDFSLNTNLMLINKKIFWNLINIPKEFGRLQHIRGISEAILSSTRTTNNE